jgi:geranylgeranyl pyrophosphate synthase
MKVANSDEPSSQSHAQLASETERCAEHGVDVGLFERALLASTRSFLERPGKAFRARLVEGAFLVAGGKPGALPRAAHEAIELLHAGSLIVDDIEDGADERRGAPALHRQVGTPRALNAGNWLYFVALSRLAELPLSALRERDLTRAAHVCLMRCHEGQALDLGLRISELRRSDVRGVAEATSRLKTGALVGFAARLGATVARAPARDVEALVRFGEQLGVALQMLDDLTSFTCDERAHKAYEDLRAERPSFIWTFAAETLDEVTYKHLSLQVKRSDAHEALRLRLAEAAESGRLAVRTLLAEALGTARQHFADNPALELLSLELLRLEKSYG